MEILSLKEKLICRINSADKKSLLVIDQILDHLELQNKDFFDTLPSEIQELLIESIKQIENGQTYTHEQVREMTVERYGFKR